MTSFKSYCYDLGWMDRDYFIFSVQPFNLSLTLFSVLLVKISLNDGYDSKRIIEYVVPTFVIQHIIHINKCILIFEILKKTN